MDFKLIILFLFIMQFLGWLQNSAKIKRGKGFTRFAAGLDMDMPPEVRLSRSLLSLPLLSQARRIEHLVVGQAMGVTVRLFDVVSEGRPQTAITFSTSDLELPPFVLRPRQESADDKALVVADPAFNRRFSVFSQNQDQNQHFFSNPRREALMNHSFEGAEGEGRHLILFSPGKKLSPDELRPSLEEALQVFKVMRPRAEAG